MTSATPPYKRSLFFMEEENSSMTTLKKEKEQNVAKYAESLLTSDSLIWKSYFSLQVTASSLDQRFSQVKQVEPTARSLLSLSMLYSLQSLSEKNLKKCDQLIDHTLGRLSKRERGKIFKLVALLEHEYSQQIRSVLLPKLYHAATGYAGKSVREILLLAKEYASKLPNAPAEVLDNIQALKQVSKSYQKPLLIEWLQSIQSRLDLLDQGKEVLLTRYFISNNSEKYIIVDQELSSTNKSNIIYGLSCAIEGLNAEPVDNRMSSSLQQRISCSVKIILNTSSLVTAKNVPLILSSVVVRNSQNFKINELHYIDLLRAQLKKNISAVLFSYDVMLLEQEFLGNVLRLLLPRHWLKDSPLKLLLNTFPPLDTLPEEELPNTQELVTSQTELSAPFDPNDFLAI